MKKITIKLFLMLLMVLCATSAKAFCDFCVDGIYYRVNGSEAIVTYESTYNSYSGNVTIPTTVNYNGITYSVTSIDPYTFQKCTALTSITIPESITSIGEQAFLGCNSLSSVNITNIAAWCKINFSNNASNGNYYSNPLIVAHHLFLNGTEVINLAIPNTVTSIKDYAFYGCTGIISVSIPNSVTSIGSSAFNGCRGLTSITIPNSVTSIGESTFSGCASLASVSIPNSVTAIGNSAFYGCSNLTSVTIPNSVNYIGNSAFLNCSSLTDLHFNAISCQNFSQYTGPFNGTFISTIEIGNSVQQIPSFFVYGLTTVRTVRMGNSVAKIGSCAFYGCNCMTDLTLGNSVTSIGSSAFYDCSGLRSITLPSSLRTVEDKAFYNCSRMSSVFCFAANPPVMGSSDCFNSYNTATLYVPYQNLDSYKNTYYWNYFKKIYGIDSEGNILATDISLNASEKNLNVNQTYKLIATITPDVTTNKTVNWTSSNSTVAKVDNDGMVTAIADGTATITATTTDGTNLNESCTVTVTSIPASSISLNKTSLTLDINETYTLIASILPSNATDKSVTWKSSNNAIATVSSNGVVTPKSHGNVEITATTNDGTNLSASCQLTVVKLVKSITLNENSITLTLPETSQLIATITPSDATTPTLTWTSSKTSVATVDNNGLITSVGVGTATIKVNTTDGTNLSASCYVTVNRQLVTSITLNDTNRVMNIGDTFQLVADVVPDNASNKALIWSTGNASVATVDNNGLVTARSSGTTYVRASTTDGSYTYADCSIEVLPDFYLTLDTLSHIRGVAAQVIDLQVSLVNKNPISGIQFDVTLPSGVEFNLVDSLPDVWLDDARKTRTHSISASQLSSGIYRILISSSSSKDLKGNDGVVCHLNMLLPQQHNIGDYSINVSNIIASEADETRHTLNNTSAIIHYYYIVGDADANAIVDIADYTATASKILGKSPSPFYSDAANVDGNNSLDVVDLVGITNIALEIKPITVRQAPARNNIADRLLCDNLKFNAAGEAEVNIGIDCVFDFAGFQMDVGLPSGLTLLDTNLGEMASRLGLATEVMQDGKIRLLGTSFTDAVVSGGCPELLRLKVKAGMNYMQGSNIEFSDIIFAERDLTCHSFDGSCIEYIEPSSVYELTDGIRIYVEDGNIIVDTPVAGTVQLIAIDGRMTEYQAQVGHNVYSFGIDGIYVVHFNGKTLKIKL